MRLGAYLSSPVTVIRRWWYDKDKPADVALLTLALAVLTPLPVRVAAIVAAVGYFGIGKLLVSAELIPHGAHKPEGVEAIHWVGEIALCALPPVLVVAAERRGWAFLLPLALLALYLLAIHFTPETSP